MNAYNTVRLIIAATAIALVGLYLLASTVWPQLAEQGYVGLAIALPLIGGLAILSPIFFKIWRKP